MKKSLFLKKLFYRSLYRGCKETDIIFGNFAIEKLSSLSTQELEVYEKLLEVNDNSFYNWITGLEEIPEQYNTSVFRNIKELNERQSKI